MGNREIKNIFTYASKELSQDAFLRWILENYNCDDKDVCDACYDLLTLFGVNLSHEEIKSIKTFSQVNKIDISAEIETSNSLYNLYIEDKVYSCEHNQLERYNKKINSKNNIEVIKIFYKTSKIYDEREIKRIKDAGWTIISFYEINNLWKKYVNSNNLILNQYANHIVEMFNISIINKMPQDDNLFKWQAYFDNVIKTKFKNKVIVYVGNYQNKYSYIAIRPNKFEEWGFPYLEIRSRDIKNNQFISRILTYGIEGYKNDIDTQRQIKQQLIDNIGNKKLDIKVTYTIKRNKQIGIMKNNFINEEDLILKIDKCISEYLEVVKNVG